MLGFLIFFFFCQHSMVLTESGVSPVGPTDLEPESSSRLAGYVAVSQRPAFSQPRPSFL